MWVWITLAAGLGLVLVEFIMASRKPGGVSATDKQRIWGILWIAIALTALVWAVFAFWPD